MSPKGFYLLVCLLIPENHSIIFATYYSQNYSGIFCLSLAIKLSCWYDLVLSQKMVTQVDQSEPLYVSYVLHQFDSGKLVGNQAGTINTGNGILGKL